MIAASVMVGCKDDQTSQGTDLTLSKSEMTMVVSASETLEVTAPSDLAKDPNLCWTSLAPEIAKVDKATGKVVAVSAGTTKIYAFVDGAKSVSGMCVVKVVSAILKVETPEITAVAGVPTKVSFSYASPMATGWQVSTASSDTTGGKIMKITVDPNKLVDKKPVAYDPATGKCTFEVLGLKEGSVSLKIFNTAANPRGNVKGSAIDSVKINFVDVPVTSFTFNSENPTKLVLGKNASVKVDILPVEAKFKQVNYLSGNEGVFKVDKNSGAITPVAQGSATLFAQLDDINIKTTISVSGADVSDKVIFAEDSLYIALGASKTTIPLTTNPAGGVVKIVIDNNGYKAPVVISDVVLSGGGTTWAVQAPYAVTSHGSARLIASVEDAKGKVTRDTCEVFVTGFSAKNVLFKATYEGADFGKSTIIRGYMNNYANTAKLNKATLYRIKKTKVDGKEVVENVVIQEIKDINKTVTAFDVASVVFDKITTNTEDRKNYRVQFDFNVNTANYSVVQSLVADDGASFAPKK